jgi:hypothetical protein
MTSHTCPIPSGDDWSHTHTLLSWDVLCALVSFVLSFLEVML